MTESVLTKAWLVATMMMFSVAPASADQRSDRLNSLFSDLAVEDLPVNAQQLEREIWQVWMDSGDDKVNLELTIGTNAMNEGPMEDAIHQFSKVTEMASDFAEGWIDGTGKSIFEGNMVQPFAFPVSELSLIERVFTACYNARGSRFAKPLTV